MPVTQKTSDHSKLAERIIVHVYMHSRNIYQTYLHTFARTMQSACPYVQCTHSIAIRVCKQTTLYQSPCTENQVTKISNRLNANRGEESTTAGGEKAALEALPTARCLL